MKTHKQILSGIFGVLLISVMLAACSNAFNGEPELPQADTAPSTGTLTRSDYLALSRITESKTVDVQSLEKVDFDFSYQASWLLPIPTQSNGGGTIGGL
jgi:hypothetical protein